MLFKSTIENFQDIKQELLNKISVFGNVRHTNVDQTCISDWDLPAETPRAYGELFLKAVKPHLEHMKESLKVENYEIINYWFQQYQNNDYHGWHVHRSCHYANVFFIECESEDRTRFKHFDLDCKEGDVISFPAFFPHSSYSSNPNRRKTVIAFNTDFFCYHD